MRAFFLLKHDFPLNAFGFLYVMRALYVHRGDDSRALYQRNRKGKLKSRSNYYSSCARTSHIIPRIRLRAALWLRIVDPNFFFVCVQRSELSTTTKSIIARMCCISTEWVRAKLSICIRRLLTYIYPFGYMLIPLLNGWCAALLALAQTQVGKRHLRTRISIFLFRVALLIKPLYSECEKKECAIRHQTSWL